MSAIDYGMAMRIAEASDRARDAAEWLRAFEWSDVVPEPYGDESTTRCLRNLKLRAAEVTRLAGVLERRITRDRRARKREADRAYRELRQLIDVEGTFVKPGEYFSVVGDSFDCDGQHGLTIQVVRLNPKTVTVRVLDTGRTEHVRPERLSTAHRLTPERVAEMFPKEFPHVPAPVATL